MAQAPDRQNPAGRVPRRPVPGGVAGAGEGGGAAEAIDVEAAVDDFVRHAPDQEFNFAHIRDRNRGLPKEPLKSRLTRLKDQNLLEVTRRAKIPGNAQSKDRKVIHYRATEAYRRRLGLDGADAGEPAADVAADAAGMLRAIGAQAAAQGFVAPLADLANFFLCLQAKPFVILSGVSGTGKSRLPRLVAEAVGASHRLIPVKPNWTDNSDLMGFYNVVARRFRSGPLLEAVGEALDDPDRPCIVVLDEMNLAHVEHYLSDVLSVMETRRRGAGGEVVSDALPLDLPSDGDIPGDEEEAERLDERRDWYLPWNLFLVGTVNVDETTHPFSRKVLDRAYAIDQDHIDLTRFGGAGDVDGDARPLAGAGRLLLERPLSVGEAYPLDPAFFDGIARELEIVNAALRPAQLHFAYRVRDEVCLYMWAWRRHGLAALMSRDEAFDLCLLQKVLPRCQGSSETARQALEGVLAHASRSPVPAAEQVAAIDGDQAQNPEQAGADGGQKEIGRGGGPAGDARGTATERYPRTARKARAMLERYRDAGYFAFWS